MLKTLIKVVSGTGVAEKDLEHGAHTLGISLSEFCNDFALEIAKGYMRGDYSWDFGDTAMNGLYACAYGVGDFSLPDLALQVYEAFDEGEYRHLDDPRPNGEPRTRARLEPLIARLHS
jgi:hypothetical protein